VIESDSHLTRLATRAVIGLFCAAANAAHCNSTRKASNFSLYGKRWRPCR
jgi:hypothetical protein